MVRQEQPIGRKNMVMSRLERKLVVSPELAGFMLAWLRHYFVADPVYPKNLVTSLYLDTLGFDSYNECLNGDIYKKKIRIRWYDQPLGDRDINVYIEVKSKMGFSTVKHRKQVTFPRSLIVGDRVSNLTHLLKLGKVVLELRRLSCQRIQPVILVSYCRYRFKDPETGTSIAYDTDISSRIVTPCIGWGVGRLQIKPTVLELKSTTMTVPRVFQSVSHNNLQWSAFSKYAQCITSHLEEPGTIESVLVQDRPAWLK